MNQIIVGHFEPDGGAIYLPLGFVPDFFLLQEVGVTNPTIYTMWPSLAAEMPSGAEEGTKVNGADGVITQVTTGGGITAYDSASQGPSISQWVADTATTARSGASHGDYVKPTTASATDRDAVFEAIATSGDTKTHAATEPTWPAGVGDTVVDDAVTWQRVNVPLKRIGYQGVGISATPQTDGQEMFYVAIQADDAIDHGDVTSWASGVYGA